MMPPLFVAPPTGSGEPLVLVHGSWSDHTTWDPVVPALAECFTVVRYDRRGHSRSPYTGPTPRTRDEDDLAAIIASLGAGAHVVASSYGASVALALAGRRPDLVRRVIAHEPPLLGLVPEPEVSALVASVADQLASGDLEGGARRFFEDGILGPGAWAMLPAPLRAIAIDNARTFLDLPGLDGWDVLDAAAVARVADRVLITTGTASPPWLLRVAHGVAAAIGCPTRAIEGAGHAPHLTTPEALVALVEEELGVPALAPR